MMIFDKTEIIGKSIVQHGPNNDRAYLMKLHPEDSNKIVEKLYNLAIIKRYSKIFAKVPASNVDYFKKNNFKIEANIPRLYNGREAGYFLAQYFNSNRSYISKRELSTIKSIVSEAVEPFDPSGINLTSEYQIRTLKISDISELADLYKTVFSVYPFPIFKKKYLKTTMENNVKYFGIFKNDKLVAASSAEMDFDQKNAELTDFATHPDHLGNKLSFFLLKKMEDSMHEEGIKTLYTIARTSSHGMNKTFGRSGYIFGGTLINNTLIGESIESMNVWYKNILL
ncbi:putative beta-lysine N-acetyltransferase [Reichenbachiella sp. MALMAid0571]|uniref:putative beta-lysine N-acetyltransferase n=1 Tax=Reichenbachiella sp. MALMAid0571 TaxID=3143939 RepID=UPI0032DE82E6